MERIRVAFILFGSLFLIIYLAVESTAPNKERAVGGRDLSDLVPDLVKDPAKDRFELSFEDYIGHTLDRGMEWASSITSSFTQSLDKRFGQKPEVVSISKSKPRKRVVRAKGEVKSGAKTALKAKKQPKSRVAKQVLKNLGGVKKVLKDSEYRYVKANRERSESDFYLHDSLLSEEEMMEFRNDTGVELAEGFYSELDPDLKQ